LSLSSTGTITGKPTVAGAVTSTIQISDAESLPQTATSQLSYIINPATTVITQHYDNFRTGQNLNETILTPANISSGRFGKIFSYSVDGDVYAQPLYVPNVGIPGKGMHNVIYIVTEHDSVYALDADSNSGGNSTPLWQTSFIDPAHGITPVSSGDVNCNNISPEIGITSTPVIDPTTGTIYVVAKTKENGSFFQRLHALDITTGAEKLDGPVTIQASYNNGALDFDPLTNNNRTGLLQSNGNIYLAWASHCDHSPYNGWIIAYDQATLQQKAVWIDTPNGTRGGIWMSGAGLAADAMGRVFLSIGNGTFDTTGNPVDFGESIVKLAQVGGLLALTDYFTPYDQANLNEGDIDVGSGGVLLLPDQPGPHLHELVEAGKEGTIYVVDRDNMGHYNPNDNSQIVQNLAGEIGGMYAVPAYWNGTVYFGSASHSVEAFTLSNGLLSTTPTSNGPTNLGFPGASPVISSDGTSNGIVWALQTATRLNNGNEVLRAYDATDLDDELYNSTQNEERDNPGVVLHFAVPTVANGKVYTGAAGQVSVFGLTIATAATPIFGPSWGTYTSPQTVTISDSTPGATIYYTTDGSTPTQSSPVYTGPITVSVTTTIKAIAAAVQYFNSPVGTAVYTITTGGGGWLNYGNGFSQNSAGLVINGSGAISGSRLRLTNGSTGQRSSAWCSIPMNIQAFTQDFAFQLTNPHGDGITFTIQNSGIRAIGPGGAGLGYGASSLNGNLGIPTSVAVKFDLYNNFGEGVDSTGLYTDGASPTVPAVDMTGSGVNLHSGDIFNVHITYDGSMLTMTITDTVTYSAFTESWPIDIPTTVGGTNAYIGFTGATGGATATQDVLNWTFASQQ
jgi:Chitobiase/beta-hexosaminidase C-terminal domain/Legume lectin domain